MKKGLCIAGIFMGLIILISGICLSLGVADVGGGGSVNSSASFGGDFYTYEYKATARAANAVLNIGHSLDSFFRIVGFINIGLGGAIACYFGNGLDDPKKARSAAIPTNAGVATKADDLPDL